MKKLVLSLAVCAMAFASTNAQDAKKPAVTKEKVEKIEIISEEPAFKFVSTDHDFGKVMEGDKAIHEFKFYNVGKKPIILTNVQASCGCTTPVWPKEPIKSGESAVIKAVYNSAGRPGPFTKTITVTSNVPGEPVRLNIKGVVEKPAEGTPVNQDQSPVKIEN